MFGLWFQVINSKLQASLLLPAITLWCGGIWGFQQSSFIPFFLVATVVLIFIVTTHWKLCLAFLGMFALGSFLMQLRLDSHPPSITNQAHWCRWKGEFRSSHRHGLLLNMASHTFPKGIWVAYEGPYLPTLDTCFLAELMPFHSKSFRSIQQWKWSNGITGKMRIIETSAKSELQSVDLNSDPNERLKNRLLACFSRDVAGFFFGLFTGNKSLIPQKLKDAFQDAGLAHILAVSGYHVGWVSLFPVFLLKHRKRIIRVIGLLGMCGIWYYLEMCQWPPSGVRAAIMASIYSVCLFLDIRISAIQSLSIAAILMFWHDPSIVMDLGVQLSFLATFSILLFVRLWNKHRMKILMAVGIPIAAQWGTQFLTASTFGYIPLFFLPANLLASVAMTLVAMLVAIWFLMDLFAISEAKICFWSDLTSWFLESTFVCLEQFCLRHPMGFHPDETLNPMWWMLSSVFYFLMIRLICSKRNIRGLLTETFCFVFAMAPWCVLAGFKDS